MREKIRKTLAERVSAYLTIRRESRSEFAQRSGVSLAVVHSVAAGRHVPTAAVLWRIARALGVPVDDLLR